MATKKPEPKTPALTRAAVLVDCSYGRCGEVVTLATDDAASGVNAGELDTNPAAVAYAESQQTGRN